MENIDKIKAGDAERARLDALLYEMSKPSAPRGQKINFCPVCDMKDEKIKRVEAELSALREELGRARAEAERLVKLHVSHRHGDCDFLLAEDMRTCAEVILSDMAKAKLGEGA